MLNTERDVGDGLVSVLRDRSGCKKFASCIGYFNGIAAGRGSTRLLPAFLGEITDRGRLRNVSFYRQGAGPDLEYPIHGSLLDQVRSSNKLLGQKRGIL
ncbi:hypothetical protein DQK91_00305 [Oceanidesulfovibrio marinus]|uniref:Uncharacterized protein n=1 Tax=Oceanidesulfovibrio marinus TaxID=370038 RepID=A0A6P1ZLM3_9BACT|nr:hypothetical protein DQK91_00305 [Oceanidesulfovibrio marinus]